MTSTLNNWSSLSNQDILNNLFFSVSRNQILKLLFGNNKLYR